MHGPARSTKGEADGSTRKLLWLIIIIITYAGHKNEMSNTSDGLTSFNFISMGHFRVMHTVPLSFTMTFSDDHCHARLSVNWAIYEGPKIAYMISNRDV